MTTTLMALLPVAISGLVGAIVGFYFARKERKHRLSVMREREYEQPSLPFAHTAIR